MLLNLKLFISLLVIGLLVDFVWIGLLANKFYLAQFGDLARLKPDGNFDVVKWAGFVVYVLIGLGIVFFVLPKIGMDDSYLMALGWGFFFGFILYGLYDFTNYATIAKWTLSMCLVDALWGSVLCAILTGAGKYLRDSVF